MAGMAAIAVAHLVSVPLPVREERTLRAKRRATNSYLDGQPGKRQQRFRASSNNRDTTFATRPPKPSDLDPAQDEHDNHRPAKRKSPSAAERPEKRLRSSRCGQAHVKTEAQEDPAIEDAAAIDGTSSIDGPRVEDETLEEREVHENSRVELSNDTAESTPKNGTNANRKIRICNPQRRLTTQIAVDSGIRRQCESPVRPKVSKPSPRQILDNLSKKQDRTRDSLVTPVKEDVSDLLSKLEVGKAPLPLNLDPKTLKRLGRDSKWKAARYMPIIEAARECGTPRSAKAYIIKQSLESRARGSYPTTDKEEEWDRRSFFYGFWLGCQHCRQDHGKDELCALSSSRSTNRSRRRPAG